MNNLENHNKYKKLFKYGNSETSQARDKIKDKMKETNMSYHFLAKKIGVDPSSLWRFLNNKNRFAYYEVVARCFKELQIK